MGRRQGWAWTGQAPPPCPAAEGDGVALARGAELGGCLGCAALLVLWAALPRDVGWEGVRPGGVLAVGGGVLTSGWWWPLMMGCFMPMSGRTAQFVGHGGGACGRRGTSSGFGALEQQASRCSTSSYVIAVTVAPWP